MIALFVNIVEREKQKLSQQSHCNEDIATIQFNKAIATKPL